jgi:hypothetical protein
MSTSLPCPVPCLILARGQRPDTGELRLYVMDESSLASTKQMHEFVRRLHPNDRVLLVGDRECAKLWAGHAERAT